jgi:hypothetical protein
MLKINIYFFYKYCNLISSLLVILGIKKREVALLTKEEISRTWRKRLVVPAAWEVR